MTVATRQFDLTPPASDQLGSLADDLTAEERHLLLDRGEEAPKSDVQTCPR